MTFIVFSTIVSAVVLAASHPVMAQDVEVAPKIVNYQGKLTDAAGLPFGGEQGGTYKLRFMIYPVPSGGEAVWAEERDVVVIGGIFNVALGGAGGVAVNEIPMDLGAAFSAPERFLETTVVSGPEGSINQTLAPRQQLASVPYALVSQTTDRAAVAALAESLIPELMRVLNPPGSMMAYGAASDPSGWLICNGRAVSRADYASLFQMIGTSYGAGNGTTTFNIPDCRGLVLRGAGSGNINGRTKVGPTLGDRQEDQFQGHAHSLWGSGWAGTTQVHANLGIGKTNFSEQTSRVTGDIYYTQGSSGAPRVGAETRVSSLGVNFIIKY